MLPARPRDVLNVNGQAFHDWQAEAPHHARGEGTAEKQRRRWQGNTAAQCCAEQEQQRKSKEIIPMKIFILADMEGVAGVANFEDYTSPTSRFYQQSRHLLTMEVNAAIEGALAAGATDFLVADWHGPGGVNLEAARLAHGTNKPRTCGFDASFGAMFFVGQHAMSNTDGAGMAHSFSSRTVENIYLNGERIGEFGMWSILAGYFKVPVVLVSGDNKMREEALRLVPNLEAVVVKESFNFSSAITLAPQKARQLIRAAAERAVKRRAEIKPYFVPPPYELVVEFKAAEFAADKAQTPGWRRVNTITLKKTGNDFLEVFY